MVDVLDYESIQQVNFDSNTRFLFHIDFYDAPLTGIMIWEGEMLYFSYLMDWVFPIPKTKSDYSIEELEDIAEFWEKSISDLDGQELNDYEISRIYNLYRLPKNTLDKILIKYTHLYNMGWKHLFYKNSLKRDLLKDLTTEERKEIEKYMKTKKFKQGKKLKYNVNLLDCEYVTTFKL